MKKFNLKKTLLLTAFAIFSTSATAPALSGGLQSELNELFGNISNYTQPGIYESTRRGVLAGGGAQIRSRRMNIQLIAFEPPNIKAGCGGIDIFLGSFSYINLDQFISFLRAIAANAAGYAFQMALTRILHEPQKKPTCEQVGFSCKRLCDSQKEWSSLL